MKNEDLQTKLATSYAVSLNQKCDLAMQTYTCTINTITVLIFTFIHRTLKNVSS